MSNLIEHARLELAIMREQSRKALMEQDPPATESDLKFQLIYEAMQNNLLAMVAVFSVGNYSGSLVPMAIGQLNTLLNLKPLTPLTGEDEEWSNEGQLQQGLLQNKRCSSLFKNIFTGQFFQVDAIIWYRPEDPNNYFTNNKSFVTIDSFPYYPRDKEIRKWTPEMDSELKSEIDVKVEKTR